MPTYTSEQVIVAYVKVLQELAALKKLARAPEEVLPLPKDEMATLLQRSTHPEKEQLIELLAMFESGATTAIFLSQLVVRPAVLTLAYAVVIAVQGASWFWMPIALLGGVGAFIATMQWAWVEAWAILPKWKRWAWLLLIVFGELAAVGCWGAIWVRLVIMSGFYGLYQATWVRLNGFGIFSGLLSLALGHFFSKQLNAFFFFVTQYTSRRKFRADTRPGRKFEKKRLFGSSKQETEAIIQIYESIPLPKGSPDEIAQRALRTWRQGKRQEALALYDQAISMAPKKATLYLNRGNLKIELELIDEAINDLEVCLQLDPDMPAWNLGLLKMMQSDPRCLEGFLKKQRERISGQN